ncbi:MAG: winged helix-turn-helix domain-containing protein [Oligoflexia bacterium]|nr:winged helix-turn-helix domain-containing protein [Oligoflexia bacterium]
MNIENDNELINTLSSLKDGKDGSEFMEIKTEMMGDDDADTKIMEERRNQEVAQGHYKLAKIYYDKSDLLLAEKHFTSTLDLWVYPQDTFFIFKVYGFLVRIASELLDDEKIERYITQSENFVKKVSFANTNLCAEHFYNEGVIKTYRGSFQEALSFLNISYKKSQEENNPEVLAKSTYALASTHFQLKDFQTAIRYLDQLAEVLNILKKNYLFGSMHLLYANLYAELNDYHNALIHYKLANQTLQEKACWNLFGRILLGEGIVYKKMGEFNKALLYFDLAINSINKNIFRKLATLLNNEITDVNGSDVDLVLDRTNRMIYEKKLGPIDFKHRFVLLEILFLLAQNPGRFFDKEELARSIWKDEYNPLIHDKLIYTSVSRLRKLIEPKKQKRKYIIRGKDGYTFDTKIKVRFHKDNEVDKNSNVYAIELSSPV